MKRRNFITGGIIAAGAVAIPTTLSAQKSDTFSHDPIDYALVAEEIEEFQELDEALTDTQFGENIEWI